MFMSLGRLLATGKSLIGVKDAESPYKMTAKGRVPKFGAARNPFATPGAADSTTTLVAETRKPAMPATSPSPTQTGDLATPMLFEANASNVNESAQLDATDMTNVTDKSASTASADKNPSVVPEPATCAEELPMPTPSSEAPEAMVTTPSGVGGQLSEQPSSARPAIRPATGGWLKKLNPLRWFERRQPEPFGHTVAVQPELSLETVKVMRNDLNDADLLAVERPSILQPGKKVPAWKGQPRSSPWAKPRKQRVSPDVFSDQGQPR